MAEPVRRRRRVRVTPQEPSSSLAAPQAAVAEEAAPWDGEAPAAVEPDLSHAERGLRGLVGGGSSQVTPAAALRARDASRPRAEDLARAEADLVIVRRNWTPPRSP